MPPVSDSELAPAGVGLHVFIGFQQVFNCLQTCIFWQGARSRLNPAHPLQQ